MFKNVETNCLCCSLAWWQGGELKYSDCIFMWICCVKNNCLQSVLSFLKITFLSSYTGKAKSIIKKHIHLYETGHIKSNAIRPVFLHNYRYSIIMYQNMFPIRDHPLQTWIDIIQNKSVSIFSCITTSFKSILTT